MNRRQALKLALAALTGGTIAPLLPTPTPIHDKLVRDLTRAGIEIPFKVLPTDIYVRGPLYRVLYGRLYPHASIPIASGEAAG
jgi:hypothetical protein